MISAIRTAAGSSRYHAVIVVLAYAFLFFAFFSPVLLKGHLLSVGGDGLYVYLPNFYSPKVLWDPLLFSGFPMMADPQVMSWYPPAMLLSLVPNTWNIFIIFAYVAASCFTYGYVYALTNSRIAAAFSGTAFGLSGFMMAHLGHAVIIHATAWLPLMIWSLEMLRQRRSALWFATSTLAVALCCMGGHSQIFVYGLILSVGYLAVVGWNAPVGRWRYYSVALASVFAGIALAAVQILPTAELVRQSTRVSYSFLDFVSHALPPRQALTMIFPSVFGGRSESGVLAYFGAKNQTELTGYVGLLPLLLAALGLIATRRRSLSLFWLFTALLAFLLALGEATPLARMTYHLPIINQLRAPARHFVEFTLALSVLSGLGLAALINRQVSMRQLLRIIFFAIVVMLGCLVLLFLNSDYMAGLAARQGVSRLQLLPWANRSVGVPILVFLTGLGALVFWFKQPKSSIRVALLMSVLVIDLGSFGWFYEWRYVSQDKQALTAPAEAERYRPLLEAGNQRLMPYPGQPGTLYKMTPNLTRLWGVSNASGYDALILSRYSHLLDMLEVGMITRPTWWKSKDQSLNLAAVRYVFMPHPAVITDQSGVRWQKQDLELWLGEGCNYPATDSVTFNPTSQPASTILIVSRLACAVSIPNGVEMAQMRVVDTAGQTELHSLLAGRDSSDWGYDCETVKPYLKHKKAEIFDNYNAKVYEESCQGHFYRSRFTLSTRKNVKSIELRWTGPSGAMILDKITLVDDELHSSHPVDPMTEGNRWRLNEETDEFRVFENLAAMPRVWLVPEALMVKEEEARTAAQTSKLPNGREFDPKRTALVEEPLSLAVANPDPEASARIVALANNSMEVQTDSTRPMVLVTSDVYYPGWQATVDEQQVTLYRADYAFRGVAVPAGQHLVKLSYRPRRFYLGAAISLGCLLGLSGLVLSSWAKRTRTKS